MLRYGVLLSSSLHLFGFFVLVSYLKQEHKERHRLSHYLQKTNTALGRGTYICVINPEPGGNGFKCLHS